MILRPFRGLLALGLALPCLAEELILPPPPPLPAQQTQITRRVTPWSTQDTLWELSYVAVVAMDCSQSRQIEDGGRYERNPLLPRHPSASTITNLCLLNVAAHAAISYALPSPWRRRWQAATVVLEAGVVADNYYRAGVKFKF